MINYPISTEKAIRLMESQNKLTFIVDRNAHKPDIKSEIARTFKVKVLSVRTAIMPDGRKKAIVKLAKDYPAIDIATRLGLI